MTTKTNRCEELAINMNFVILIKIMLINLPTLILSEECKQTGPCSCETSDSVLDLSQLTTPNPNPSLIFRDMESVNKYEYSFMPCVALKQSTCSPSYPVAVCQKELPVTTGRSFVTGEWNTAKFFTNTSNNLPGITYYSSHNSDKQNRTTTVVLRCATSTSFKLIGKNPTLTYPFELASPAACFHPKPSSGVSIGTVLLIIFMILVLIYIVVGVLYMHYVKGAEGIEKFPNIEFWKEFPLLVRDGCLFVIRGCKTDTTYSKI